MWALFAGIALLLLGMGLQGTLLGVRASLSGFGTEVTGVVMACYYVGFMAGSWSTPRLLRRVGPHRVFAAMASLVSFAPLAHALMVSPLAWAFLRILTGSCMVGIYIIAESWLNGEADSGSRGRLLSSYLIVCQVSLAGGQFLLGVADPRGFELFVLISALCSLAVVPIALTRRSAPRHEEAASVPLGVLMKRIPHTMIGVLVISLSYGCFYAMGAVYALEIGLERTQIATFMASAILGSVVLQWPVGLLSDRFDRRRVIVWLCFAVSAVAVMISMVPTSTPGLIYLLMFLYGGLSLPLYAVFVALAGDSLERDELVGASSKILLANGLGSAVGPMLVAWLMSHVSNAAYGLFIALVHVAVALLGLRSLASVPRVVVGQPAHFTPVSPQLSVVATEMAGRVAAEQGGAQQ